MSIWKILLFLLTANPGHAKGETYKYMYSNLHPQSVRTPVPLTVQVGTTQCLTNGLSMVPLESTATTGAATVGLGMMQRNSARMKEDTWPLSTLMH